MKKTTTAPLFGGLFHAFQIAAVCCIFLCAFPFGGIAQESGVSEIPDGLIEAYKDLARADYPEMSEEGITEDALLRAALSQIRSQAPEGFPSIAIEEATVQEGYLPADPDGLVLTVYYRFYRKNGRGADSACVAYRQWRVSKAAVGNLRGHLLRP